MKDIGDMTVAQLEDLLDGLSENAEEQQRSLNGDKEILEGDAAIDALLGR